MERLLSGQNFPNLQALYFPKFRKDFTLDEVEKSITQKLPRCNTRGFLRFA
jgi:hypothetical protein